MERIQPTEPRRGVNELREPKVREVTLLGQQFMTQDSDRQDD